MKGTILRLFDLQEEDKKLAQNFDSLLQVVQLTWVTRNWRLRLFCIVWVSSLLLKDTPYTLSPSICL